MSPTRKSPFGTRSRATSIESGDASKPATRAPRPEASSADRGPVNFAKLPKLVRGVVPL